MDYSIFGSIYPENDPALPVVLATIYPQKERPLCLCREPGVPMYIARIADLYVIKRMPDSGMSHAPHCDSYEPPPELSGLGDVMGHAIKEDEGSGLTALKLDFALSKTAGHAPPASSGGESDTVKTDGSKLSLRSVLHYFWDEAGLNKWSPRMAGRRNWFVIHRCLSGAAEGKSTKGMALANSLYVPEPFYVDRKDEISRRRDARFGDLQKQTKGVRKLMILAGEVKEICPARYGHKIVVKQLPDCQFMLPEDVHKRLVKRFEGELALWQAIEGSHLMVIATFGVGLTGVASIEEVSLMITTENWIPFEGIQEKALLDALTEQSRRFVKGLRYNLPLNRPLASVVLTDTQPTPTAMYVIGAEADADHTRAIEELAENSSLDSWIWRVGTESMPLFPRTTRVSDVFAASNARSNTHAD